MVALYKYDHFIQKTQHGAFDEIHQPGTLAPYPGIYRCEGCGHEIGIARTHILPPQGHHQHTKEQGDIRWQLTVSHS